MDSDFFETNPILQKEFQTLQQHVHQVISLPLPTEKKNKKPQGHDWKVNVKGQSKFRSPLSVFHENYQSKHRFDTHDLLLYLKKVHEEAREHNIRRDDQLVYFHNKWESVITNPEQARNDIELAKIGAKCNSQKQLRAHNVLDLDHFEKSLKLTSGQEGTLRHLPRVEDLLLVENVEDLLIDQKSLQPVMAWMTKLFSETKKGGFVQIVLLHGAPGIGKKSFLKCFLEQPPLWLDLSWLCLSNPLDLDICEEWLQNHLAPPASPLDSSQRVTKLVLVISDCDGLDQTGNTKLTHLFQIAEKVPSKRQILVVFVGSDVSTGPLGDLRRKGDPKKSRNSNIRKWELKPARMEHWKKLYSRARGKIRNSSEEPLEHHTFPDPTRDPALLFILEQNDVRALFNELTFRWATMDGVRSFEFPSNIKVLPRSVETQITIGCFDLTMMVTRQIVPLTLSRVVTKKSDAYKKDSLLAVLDVNKPGVSKEPLWAHSFKLDTVAMHNTIMMMMVHMWAYGLGFLSGPAMHERLIGTPVAELSDVKLKVKTTRDDIDEILRTQAEHVADYFGYARSCLEPEKHLLKALVGGESLASFRREREWKGEHRFSVEYYGGYRDVKKNMNSFQQKALGWKRSLDQEEQIHLFQFSLSEMSRCYGKQIDQFNGDERPDRDITKIELLGDSKLEKKKKPPKKTPKKKIKSTTNKEEKKKKPIKKRKIEDTGVEAEAKAEAEEVVTKKKRRRNTKKDKNLRTLKQFFQVVKQIK